MDIIAFYNPLNIVFAKNQHGVHFVVKRHEGKTPEILYRGNWETCNKAFIMLAAGFIN